LIENWNMTNCRTPYFYSITGCAPCDNLDNVQIT